MKVTLAFPDNTEATFNTEHIPREEDTILYGGTKYGINEICWRIPTFDIQLVLKEIPK